MAPNSVEEKRNMLLKLIKIILRFIMVTVLFGCTNTSVSTLSPPNVPEDANQVGLTESDIELTYPITTKSLVYPDKVRGPDFSINEPVKAGDLSVSGTGPVGVPIVLVDVSLVGEPIAYTTIGKDGIFIFNFDKPLPAGHSIGIQLGDITGTDFSPSEFQFNETYYERPLIGTIFDMVNIKE